MNYKQPDWYEAGRRHLWPPYCQTKTMEPQTPIERTQDSRMLTCDGRSLVDGVGSWWTAVHGYNHPHITQAVNAQLARMPHVMLGGLVHEQACRLATRLAEIAPGDLQHVFFSDSGSVAVEVAMKMAVQYWRNRGVAGRSKFISFLGGYHGDTFATMSVCDPEEGMHGMFAGSLQAQHIRELPRTDAQAEELKVFAAGRDDIAGIIVEPLLQGAGGMVLHSPHELRRLREICDELDLFLIFDEIFTGFGRTGAMFAADKAGVEPDIMTVGKALTGGFLPLAATIASRRIYDGFYSDDPDHALMHGPTFMGNATACAAANASLDLFETEPRLSQVERIQDQLRHDLSPLADVPGVCDVRVLGAMGVVELDKSRPIAGMARQFLELGVFIRPFRQCVYLTPAYTITEEELSMLTGAISKVINREGMASDE